MGTCWTFQRRRIGWLKARRRVIVGEDSKHFFTFALNEKSPETGTSTIEDGMPFFPVNSVALDLVSDIGGLLFVLVSLIEVWDSC